MALRNLSRRSRKLVIAGLSAALLAVSGVTVWRVLRPAEVVTSATYTYPDAAIPIPGRVGALISTPLIVDDRLRIYTKKREIWSDGPPTYHYERSAYWSYRRWPEQVIALAFVHQGDAPLVVSSWSDGLLVALHAGTGQVAWRVQGDTLASEYPGRRTGALAIYPEAGLLTTQLGFVTSGAVLRGYATDGTETWKRQTPVDAKCRGTEFTTASLWLVHDTCTGAVKRVDTTNGADLPDLALGNPTGLEPLTCVSGHSQCQAMRTLGEKTQGWILTATEPVKSDPLSRPGSVLVNGLVATIDTPTEVTARDPATGQPLWTWTAPTPVQLLAAGSDRVFVLLTDRVLAGLDLRNGANLTRSGINFPSEPVNPYAVAAVYTSSRYIVLERVNPDVPHTEDDDTYYFTHRPVLIAIA